MTPVRRGQWYRTLRDIPIHTLIHWRGPFTGGSEDVLPAGEIITVTADPHENESFAYCEPERYQELHARFVPAQDRVHPKYDSYSILVDLQVLQNDCELIQARAEPADVIPKADRRRDGGKYALCPFCRERAPTTTRRMLLAGDGHGSRRIVPRYLSVPCCSMCRRRLPWIKAICLLMGSVAGLLLYLLVRLLSFATLFPVDVEGSTGLICFVLGGAGVVTLGVHGALCTQVNHWLKRHGQLSKDTRSTSEKESREVVR